MFWIGKKCGRFISPSRQKKRARGENPIDKPSRP